MASALRTAGGRASQHRLHGAAAGQRSIAPPKPTGASSSARGKAKLFTPGISDNGFFNSGEVTVDPQHLLALQNLYETHPTLKSASSVLESQLLKGGLTLRRSGEPLECSAAFREHLDFHWMGFAQGLVRHFLISGFAVVSYEQEPKHCATTQYKRKKRRGGRANSARLAEQLFEPPLVPYVVPFRAYRLTWMLAGRVNYVREYRVYSHGRFDAGIDPDEDVVLHIANPPDDFGHSNSAVASVWNQSHFTDLLVEQAAIAEPARAQPALVTEQETEKQTNGISPQDMFFDSASRDVMRGQQDDENLAQASALRSAVQFSEMINRMTGASTPAGGARIGPSGPFGGGGSAPHTVVGGRLLALPKGQRSASHAPVPETRSDLAELLRFSNEEMCVAMGTCTRAHAHTRTHSSSAHHTTLLRCGPQVCPPPCCTMAALRARRPRSTLPLPYTRVWHTLTRRPPVLRRLALLNTTVQFLTRQVNKALTAAFLDIYGDDDDDEGGGGERREREGGDGFQYSSLGIKTAAASSSSSGSKRGGGAGSASSLPSVGANAREGIELVVAASPLSSTEEVLALFTGGIADFEAAAPLALNAVGLDPDQIQQALKRQKKREAEEKAERNKLEKEAKEQRSQASSGGGGGGGGGGSGGSGGGGGGSSSSGHQSASISVQMVPPAGIAAQPGAAAGTAAGQRGSGAR
jgi:hypothetical protein